MRGSWLQPLFAAAAIALALGALAADPPLPPPPPPLFPPPLDVKSLSGTKRPAQPPVKPKLEDPIAADEEMLKSAGVGVSAPALLEFFRKRTLPMTERAEVEQLVRRLGAESYRERERATADLVGRGPRVLELLRASVSDHDRERVRRAERIVERIVERDVPAAVPPAAVRLLAARKPADAVQVMLAFAPFADNEGVLDEIRALLRTLAVRAGKTDAHLEAALTDALPLRRALAGEALARTAYKRHEAPLRKLLADSDVTVRYRVGEALAYARQRDAVPVVIEALPELPRGLAWQAEDLLLRLAGAKAPAVSLGSDRAGRQKCRDAWRRWWKIEGEKIDLARLEETPKLLGRTLVVLLDQGRVMELGPDNQPLWHVGRLNFPLDAQMIGDDRLLVAEYHGNCVTERDLRGNVLWQHEVRGPLVAQRLPNGNTFVATDSELLEFTREGKEILGIQVPGGPKRVMKAMKLPGGDILCLTSDPRVVRFDAAGKEVHSFPVELGMRLYGGRLYTLPSGRVLVPHNAEGKVVEYDSRGKVVWETAAEQPVAAVRLPNGNTLITSMNATIGAVEVDRAGREVWSYRAPTRVTRALRR